MKKNAYGAMSTSELMEIETDFRLFLTSEPAHSREDRLDRAAIIQSLENVVAELENRNYRPKTWMDD